MNEVELRMAKKALINEIVEIGHRFKDGKLSPSDISTFDTLTHSVKNLCKVISDAERDERDGYGYSERGYGGYSNARWPMYPDYYGRRDSMGRYSRTANHIDELRDIMDGTTDQATRSELQKLIADMERDMRE